MISIPWTSSGFCARDDNDVPRGRVRMWPFDEGDCVFGEKWVKDGLRRRRDIVERALGVGVGADVARAKKHVDVMKMKFIVSSSQSILF